MSNNEKKSSLAELLEEYFPGAGKEAEQVLKDKFGSFPEEEAETVSMEEAEVFSEEIISLDGSEEDDTEEVPDEPFEVPEEAEETETVNGEEFSTLSRWSDWADETIAANAAASETFDAAETDEAETDRAETEAADEENAPEEQEEPEEEDTETEEEVTETETETEEAGNVSEEDVPKEETAEAAESEKITEDEDINEKWLVRFAKGIFPVKGDSVFEVIRKIIFLAAVTVFVGAGVMLASTLIQSQKAQEIQSSVHDIIVTTVATYIDDNGNVQTVPPTKEEEEQHNREVAEIFKEINEDYIGYVIVEGCDIYEPVVKGEDNEYYLRNNIYGEQNKAGTIFMDYRCTVTPEYTSPNIVIYGHNQEDETMFGRLKNYKVNYSLSDPNADFYKNNPVIKFNPEFENNEYLIYAFFVTNALENQDSNGEVFHYHDYIETMNNESTFNWYMGEVQKRNQIISPVDVQFGDKLLVLSTCSNEFTNSRFVVFARKLREGESVSDYDFSETRLNPYAKGVDWGAIMSGETSATEVTEQEEEIIDEFTTHGKSLNKRNEKTYTNATEEETVTTAAPAETATVTTVPESVTSETETETAGSADSSEGDVTEADESGSESETEVQTDENGDPAAETDENGETVTYSDTEPTESETEVTTKKKKKTETSETSEVVTSKKNSNKSNR